MGKVICQKQGKAPPGVPPMYLRCKSDVSPIQKIEAKKVLTAGYEE